MYVCYAIGPLAGRGGVNSQLLQQVLRVAVTEPIATAQPYDYADAFAVHLAWQDRDAPEAWVMAGMDRLPASVERIASLAGADEEWQVVESTEEVVRVGACDPLMHNTLVARSIGPSRRRSEERRVGKECRAGWWRGEEAVSERYGR